MSDATELAIKLEKAGANREKVIAIVDGYGDSVDWNYHSLDSIVGEVWNSDINSGDDSDGWIINEICRHFNIAEVTE
jgi:glutamate-1-semialdehyde aminotransferase